MSIYLYFFSWVWCIAFVPLYFGGYLRLKLNENKTKQSPCCIHCQKSLWLCACVQRHRHRVHWLDEGKQTAPQHKFVRSCHFEIFARARNLFDLLIDSSVSACVFCSYIHSICEFSMVYTSRHGRYTLHHARKARVVHTSRIKLHFTLATCFECEKQISAKAMCLKLLLRVHISNIPREK